MQKFASRNIFTYPSCQQDTYCLWVFLHRITVMLSYQVVSSLIISKEKLYSQVAIDEAYTKGFCLSQALVKQRRPFLLGILDTTVATFTNISNGGVDINALESYSKWLRFVFTLLNLRQCMHINSPSKCFMIGLWATIKELSDMCSRHRGLFYQSISCLAIEYSGRHFRRVCLSLRIMRDFCLLMTTFS